MALRTYHYGIILPCKTLNQLKYRLLVMYGKYSTRGEVSCQIQHSVLPRAILVTQPHACAVFSVHHSALTNTYI